MTIPMCGRVALGGRVIAGGRGVTAGNAIDHRDAPIGTGALKSW